MFDWEDILMNAVGFAAGITFIVLCGFLVVSIISEVL